MSSVILKIYSFQVKSIFREIIYVPLYEWPRYNLIDVSINLELHKFAFWSFIYVFIYMHLYNDFKLILVIINFDSKLANVKIIA